MTLRVISPESDRTILNSVATYRCLTVLDAIYLPDRMGTWAQVHATLAERIE